MTQYLQICKNALEIAHEKVKELGERGREEVKSKFVSDISTRMDQEISKSLFNYFAGSGLPAVIYSEETGRRELHGEPRLTIFYDEIDGTNNFYRGIPFFATVVAIYDSIEPKFADALVAGIMEHNSRNIWLAERGKGCRLNGRPCYVSKTTQVGKKTTLIVTDMYQSKLEHFVELNENSWMKDFGCAAYHLAGVASGTFDGFVNLGQKAHELGGGFLLIKEAGGSVLSLDGKHIDGLEYKFDDKYNIVAANEVLAREILKYIK